MKEKRVYRIFAIVAVLFGLGVCAKALINPNFTPIHLVKQSGVIAEVRFEFPIKDHKLTGKLNFLDKSLSVFSVYGRLHKQEVVNTSLDAELADFSLSGNMIHNSSLSLDEDLVCIDMESTLHHITERIILTHKRYPQWQSWRSQ